MASIQRAHQTLLERILNGPGEASPADRRAAFDDAGVTGAVETIVHKVARHAYQVTDADIAAARTEGRTEDQLFELVICAAVGQATRQYQSAMAALAAAVGEK